MKAQSDLAGDCKSAAEMTAPRICGVTIWVGHNNKGITETMKPFTIELDDSCVLDISSVTQSAVESINSVLEVT